MTTMNFVQDYQRYQHYINLRSETQIRLVQHETDLRTMRERQQTQDTTPLLQNNIARMETAINRIRDALVRINAKIRKYGSIQTTVNTLLNVDSPKTTPAFHK